VIKIGRKTKEWRKAKPKLIKIYIEKEIEITQCENCGSKYLVFFHHRPKRSSQEAIHDFEHTRLLCQKCHGFFEYNDGADEKLFKKPRGYKLENKIEIMAKKNTKKADWQTLHICKSCKKKIAGFLLCPFCGKMSI